MITVLLGLYLKLNLLLLASLLLWLFIRGLAQGLGFSVSHGLQLSLARGLFLCGLLAGPLLAVLNGLLPVFFAGLTDSLAGPFQAGEMTVSSNINAMLELSWGPSRYNLAFSLLLLVLAGLALKGVCLLSEWRKLREIVGQAMPYREIHGVCILFSAEAGTPFSTLALGHKQIILPCHLLGNSAHFQLALTHELQHLRNGDLGWIIFIEFVQLLNYWNPAAWVWRNEFHCLQEFACDEVLVSRRKISTSAYGNCLLEVATRGSTHSLLASSNMVPNFSVFRKRHSQLKRRILMLHETRSKRFSALKSFVYASLAGSGLTLSSLLVFAQGQAAGGPEERREYLPIQTIQPVYPSRALEQRLIGWVQFQFTVTEEGTVANPEVVDSCVDGPIDAPNDENGCLIEYSDIFTTSAVKALQRFRFEPRLEEGAPVQTPGVQYLFRYSLDSSSD